MSHDVVDDSDCEVLPYVRAAIHVKIGDIDVTASLDVDSTINAIHRRVFKRICEQDNDSRKYDDVENIELDLTIDGRLVVVVFHVFSDLYADMTLGEEFFASVKAHVHLELRLLKWSYQDELVITDMVENDGSFRALSGGSEAMRKETSSEVVVEASKLDGAETTASQNSGSKKRKKKKKSKKASETNNDPSHSSAATSVVEDLQRLHIQNGKSTSKKSSKEVVKIFIADRELWDMLSGECLAYYGIYSAQKEIKVLKGEVLERKVKTPMGYYMEALHDAFGEARRHGIKHLHVVSQNKDAVKLMTAHQKKYLKYGGMEPEKLPSGVGLCYSDDFINYYTACYGIPGYASLKFEYVSFDDETYEEMEHIRNLVEEYITNTPM